MKKIDSTYTFWFPIAIIGLIAIFIYMKDQNTWSLAIIYVYSFALIIYAVSHLYKIISIRKWKKVVAKIEDASYYEWYEVDRWLKVKNYSPLITYSYKVDDIIYTSNRIGLYELSYPVTIENNGDKDISQFIDKYKIGMKIDIYVNPKNPRESLLYNMVHWSYIVKYVSLLLVGLTCILTLNM